MAQRLDASLANYIGYVPRVGGLVGFSRGAIVGSYSKASVSANVGGALEACPPAANQEEGRVRCYTVGGDVFVSTLEVCAGGLVGYAESRDTFPGRIVAGYATGDVSARAVVRGVAAGGLVGCTASAHRVPFSVVASYAAQSSVSAVAPASFVGGLVGLHGTRELSVENSYWDAKVTGPSQGVGQNDGGAATPAAPSKTTGQLTAPTDYTGIYADWNVDLDGNLGVGDAQGRDDPWDFSGTDYPTLDYTAAGDLLSGPILWAPGHTPGESGAIDYDTDDDGLIEISDCATFRQSEARGTGVENTRVCGFDAAAQLDAVRYDTDGNGLPAAGDLAAYTAAFVRAPAGMGCPDSGCVGYELLSNIDLSGYQSGEGWVPISGNAGDPPPWYKATFEGNGHTISGLKINNPNLLRVGLFGAVGGAGVVKNLGIIAPSVTADSYAGSEGAMVGALAGEVHGQVKGVFVRGGSVASADAGASSTDPTDIGGLVGDLHPTASVDNSYSTAAVSGTATNQSVGGLVGTMNSTSPTSRSTITNVYAAGTVSSTSTAKGGLVGTKGRDALVTAGFYDSTVSGQSDTGKGLAKTTDELKALGVGSGGFGGNTRFILIPREYPKLPFDPFEYSSVLVSNTGQPPKRHTSGSQIGEIERLTFLTDTAQGFTTGSHSDGYLLTAAHLRLTAGDTTGVTPVFTVKICEQSSMKSTGVPPEFAPSGTCLGTLTAPGSPDVGEDDAGAVNWFTVSGAKGIELLPSTTYFVVVDVSTTGGKDLKFLATRSDDEDPRAASNAEDSMTATWSISNISRAQPSGDTAEAPTWPTISWAAESTMIGIVGHTRDTAGVESVKVVSWPSVDTNSDNIPDTYRVGDEVVVEVTMDEDVTWATTNDISIWVSLDLNGTSQRAFLVRDGETSGTGRKLRFRLPVTSAHRDGDGSFVETANNVVKMSSTGSIETTASGDDAEFSYTGSVTYNGDLGAAGHKVDGSRAADTVAPLPTIAAVNAAGTAVVVSFDEWLAGTVELGVDDPPAVGQFTVSVDGDARTTTGVSINRHQVTVTFGGQPVVFGERIILEYSKPAALSDHPLRDRRDNQVGNFTQQVTNDIPLAWCSTGCHDYDSDNDGLIEISSAGQLNAIRWDTDGDGAPSHGHYLATGAFAGAAQGMGCPGGCVGYEIGADTRGDITIDLSSFTNWVPIPSFSGTLNGNSHTLSGLAISNRTVAGAGLFGEVTDTGKVLDLGLTGVSITANQQVGAVAGTNRGLISGVHATGAITRRSDLQPSGNPADIGGLVGHNATGAVVEVSYSEVTVGTNVGTGSSSNVGGLVGRNEGKIQAAYSTGAVTVASATRVGGFVGHNLTGGSIRASYTTGCVTTTSATTNFGAFIGHGATTAAQHNYFESKGGGCSAVARGATSKTASDLQTPTTYTGIYANWNIDLDRDTDTNPDFPWRFPAGKYPELNLGQPTIIAVTLLTRPADGTTFRAGELIRLRATFNEDVDVTTPLSSWPSLSLHSLDGWFRADARPHSRSLDQDFARTLEFGHRVQPGDQALDELAVGTHPVRGGGLNVGSPAVASRAGTPANPLVELFGLGVKVDGGDAPRDGRVDGGGGYQNASGPCRRDITLGRWHGSSLLRNAWGVGCESRANPGTYAAYFTFTLASDQQVRIHAQGGAPAEATIRLRAGRTYTGDPIATASTYGYGRAKFDGYLAAGTYTLEVAPSRHNAAVPDVSGLGYSLWAGTVVRPPGLTANIWDAQLSVQTVTSSGPQPEGCDDRHSGFECSNALTHNTFVHDGVTYRVDYVLDEPPRLYVGISPALPSPGNLDWTLHIDGRSFAIADATPNGIQLRWGNVNPALGLLDGETVDVSLRTASGACVQGIASGESVAARWTADCESVTNAGRRAAYYTFTGDGSIVEFTVTSPNATEEAYLWEWDSDNRGSAQVDAATSGSATCHNRCAYVWHRTIAGRTYTLEVTGNDAAEGGRYVVDMHGSGTAIYPSGTQCRADLGRMDYTNAELRQRGGSRPNGWTFGDNVSHDAAGNAVDDTFSWPCHSPDRPATYAKFFTFSIVEERDVRIELYGSTIAGADIVLRPGTATSGGPALGSHSPPQPVQARLDTRLQPGTYTIEVVAASVGNGGVFDLVIKQGPPPWQPPEACREDIDLVVNTSGLWKGGTYAEPCWSNARSGSHARWYTFEITGTQSVTLNSSLFTSDTFAADAYLILRAGRTYTGFSVAENDNVRPWPGWSSSTSLGLYDSQLITEIPPGVYTIEATTRWPAGGSFSLAVSARTN